MLYYNILGLFSFLGLIFSFLLLGTELGIQSQIVKQVCGVVSDGGCDKVLKSVYANGYAGITPADASVVYFASQFIIYLISCSVQRINPALLILSVFGVLISIWSVYTQAIKLKQFCALCLSIVAILCIQFLLVGLILIILGYTNNVSSFFILDYVSFFSAFILLLLILLPIKKLIKTNNNNNLKLAELKKWKLDGDLFMSLLKQEQEVDTTIWENDLIIGDPEAPILITVACNPYCSPCSKMHANINSLLNKHPKKVKIQLRFLCNNINEIDPRTKVVKAILQHAKIDFNRDNIHRILDSWFDLLDYDIWVKKYPSNENVEVNNELEMHFNWIQKSEILYTPTIFINGRKMPGRFKIDDFEILIPQYVD